MGLHVLFPVRTFWPIVLEAFSAMQRSFCKPTFQRRSTEHILRRGRNAHWSYEGARFDFFLWKIYKHRTKKHCHVLAKSVKLSTLMFWVLGNSSDPGSSHLINKITADQLNLPGSFVVAEKLWRHPRCKTGSTWSTRWKHLVYRHHGHISIKQLHISIKKWEQNGIERWCIAWPTIMYSPFSCGSIFFQLRIASFGLPTVQQIQFQLSPSRPDKIKLIVLLVFAKYRGNPANHRVGK